MNPATVRITVVNADHIDERQILVANRSIDTAEPGRLSITDLVAGEDSPGSWTRGGVTISPLPGHQIDAGRPFRLFYEFYGLESESTVRTTITIAPTTDADLLDRIRGLFGNERVQEISFDEIVIPGPDGIVQVDRTVTPSVDEGRYTLRAAVDAATGQSAAAETRILLIQR